MANTVEDIITDMESSDTDQSTDSEVSIDLHHENTHVLYRIILQLLKSTLYENL